MKRIGIVLACVLALPLGVSAQKSLAPYSYRVELAQHRLANLGYRPGSVDGRLGKQTVEAIRSFQNDRQLRTTGRPDKNTLRALEQASPDEIPTANRTTHGIAEYINQRTEPCVSEHPSAILPNRMSHGVRLGLRDTTLTLKTSYHVVPYEAPQPLLKPVRHTRRYQIAGSFVDLRTVSVERVAQQLTSGCYRLHLDCFEGESCVTEGYATQKESVRAIFAAKPEDVRRLRGAWRMLLARLGAAEERPPAEPNTQPPIEQATAPAAAIPGTE